MSGAVTGPSPTSLRIATIPGDGIGPEVVAQAVRVLDAVAATHGVKVSTTEYDLGARRYHATGETLPDSVLEELRGHDAILLGAVGHPSVPSGVLERGLLLKLRFALDHHVNLRPARLLPGVESPLRKPDGSTPAIDFIVVREGTEGPYVGTGGVVREGGPHEIATEVSINTAYGVERVVRDAFRRTVARPRKHLTLVHKNNVLVHAGGLWVRTFHRVAAEFPDVTTDYLHVDAAAIFMVTQPERFDVIVTDNLFGDIVTDLAAAIAGGIGLAASGNLDVSGTNPSMFEPVHGSAPDIAGTNAADPTAAILSVAMLLDHVGLTAAAAEIEAAVAADLATLAAGTTTTTGPSTSRRSTTQVGDAILARLTGPARDGEPVLSAASAG